MDDLKEFEATLNQDRFSFSQAAKDVVLPMEISTHPLQIMLTDQDSTQPDSHQVTNDAREEKPEPPRHIRLTGQKNGQASSISLSDLKSPALLIDHRLDIVWQNNGAVEQIWRKLGAAGDGDPKPNLLDLIFSPGFQRRISNFSSYLEFFLNQIKELLSEAELKQRISTLPADRQAGLSSMIERMSGDYGRKDLYGGYLKQVLTNAKQTTFTVVAFNCGEGRLMIFEPQADGAARQGRPARHGVTDRFEQIRSHPNPVKSSYYLLAAQIRQANILRAEMLAEDHWRLINALCQRCLRSVENFGGVFGQHAENGFFAYFLPDQNLEAEALKVIQCALQIKAEAIELGRQWKISKDWPRDLDLNIALHFEKAYLGALPASIGDIVTNFGEGLRVARAIARLTEDGEIWATKPVISRVPAAHIKSLRFGILRTDTQQQKHFLQNGFATVGSLFDLQYRNGSFEDALRLVPITQIFDGSTLGAAHQF